MIQSYNVFGSIMLLEKKLIITATAMKDGKSIARTFRFDASQKDYLEIPFGAYLETGKKPYVTLRRMSISDEDDKQDYKPPKFILEHLQKALELMSKAMHL